MFKQISSIFLICLKNNQNVPLKKYILVMNCTILIYDVVLQHEKQQHSFFNYELKNSLFHEFVKSYLELMFLFLSVLFLT